jgi:F-type H+-transporting ATPase subunit b
MRRNRVSRFPVTRKSLLRAASVLAILICAVLSARAAEEGGNASAEHATEIFKWINFALVIFAIIWAWNHWAIPKLRNSRDQIGSAIARATAAKAAADAQLHEAELKLANLQKEVAELRAVSERESAAEVERLRAATQSDAKKISAAASVEIEAAERAARLELKAIAAKLAVDGAESQLVKQLTPAAQESLVSNFVKSLEGRPN